MGDLLSDSDTGNLYIEYFAWALRSVLPQSPGMKEVRFDLCFGNQNGDLILVLYLMC